MIRLRYYQGSALESVRESLRTLHRAPLLVLPTGAGKCLGRDTPVLMFDGTIKSVQDVKIGDLLIGPDSKPRRVISLAHGEEMLYRITPIKGDPYVVNESHVLSLKQTNTNKTPKFPCQSTGGNVVNISVRDYLKKSKWWKHIHKGWRSPVNFKNKDKLPIPAYILGVWLGDGSSYHMKVTTGDKEIVEEIHNYLDSVGMSFCVEHNSPGSVNLNFCGKDRKYGRGGSPFGNALRSMNLFRNKHIPHIYKTASRKDRMEMLAGIIDTDGSMSHSGFDIILKSERLLDDVVFIARSLGFSATKKLSNKTCTNNGASGIYWRCNINGETSQIPCRIPRKKAEKRKSVKSVLNTGITVEKIGNGEYFGFEISGPDRLFLLGDFTVTHNTVMFSYMAKSAAQKGKRVLILAHRDKLIRQASQKLTDYGAQHGVIMAGYPLQRTMNIQVASVQTMVRRIRKYRFRFDMIVIDEAHLSAAKSYLQVVDAIKENQPNVVVVGVTGSPYRLDGKGLGVNAGGLYDDLIVGVGIRDLIDDGFLVQPTVYASRQQLDLSGVKTTGGDYNQKDLAELVDKPTLVGDAVEHYRKACNGVPAIAWCVTVAHAEHVAKQFSDAGIPARALSGEADTDERESVLGALARGEIKVVTFCNLLIEGVDVPEIGAAILLRPTKSLSAYLQVIGRILRPVYAEGMPLETRDERMAAIDAGPKGRRGIVLDHAGCWYIHGFADDVRDWSLEGQVKRSRKKADDDEAIKISQCPMCYRVHVPAPVCPECGHEYQVEREAGLRQVDGELTEITEEMRTRLRQDRMKVQGQARTEDQLVQLGHSPAAARRIIQARAEKQSLIADAISLISDWQSRTGGNIIAQFGLSLVQVRHQKPKKLKELLALAEAAIAALDDPSNDADHAPRRAVGEQAGLF